MEINKDTLPYLVIALLLGGGGNAGLNAFLGGSGEHGHPEMATAKQVQQLEITFTRELRKSEYESEIYKLDIAIAEMEADGEKDTAAYTRAVAQLTKFDQLLADLEAKP